MRHVDGAPLGTRGGFVGRCTPSRPTASTRSSMAFYYDFLERCTARACPAPPAGRADRGVGRRRARRAARRSIRTCRKTRSEPPDDSRRVAHHGGPAPRVGGVHARFDGPTEDEFRQIEHSLVDITARHASASSRCRTCSRSTVAGPFAVTGVSDTPSRRRIFSCRPTSAAEETACARTIIAQLATPGLPPPVTAADIERLMHVLPGGPQGRRLRSRHPHGACRRSSPSPKFLFRFERTPAGSDAPARTSASTIWSWRRGCRIFLWSTRPRRRAADAGARRAS